MSQVLGRQREVAIGRIDQIPPGEGRVFALDVLSVAVFRTRTDQVFATQPHCPHRGGPLADGILGAGSVVCPLHDRAYDLASGQLQGGDCTLATYPVRREADGTLLLTVPS